MPTVTIRRKQGAMLMTHVAAGPFEIDAEGPGPWTIEAETWSRVASQAAEWFEIDDKPRVRAPKE